eukprot:7884098-Alexandrium_andersonii.AAC.1
MRSVRIRALPNLWCLAPGFVSSGLLRPASELRQLTRSRQCPAPLASSEPATPAPESSSVSPELP